MTERFVKGTEGLWALGWTLGGAHADIVSNDPTSAIAASAIGLVPIALDHFGYRMRKAEFERRNNVGGLPYTKALAGSVGELGLVTLPTLGFYIHGDHQIAGIVALTTLALATVTRLQRSSEFTLPTPPRRSR